MAGVDEPVHQRDHLGHVPGGAWLDVRFAAAEGVIGTGETRLRSATAHQGMPAFVGGPEDLVVDIGDIPAEGDLVAARFEPPDENVKGNGRPEVADMRGA